MLRFFCGLWFLLRKRKSSAKQFLEVAYKPKTGTDLICGLVPVLVKVSVIYSRLSYVRIVRGSKARKGRILLLPERIAFA